MRCPPFLSRRAVWPLFIQDHPGCMLRSVVGAEAANMMPVQCNSDVPISLACSTGSASVLTTTSSEPCPWGTSGACNQADSRLGRPSLGYQTPADYARALTTATARPAARDESSARRAIAHPAPIGVNTNRAPVAAG